MTLEEKIASVPKLERIDSSIDSCIKIIEQEMNKRRKESSVKSVYIDEMMEHLDQFKHDFNVMRGKIRIINE